MTGTEAQKWDDVPDVRTPEEVAAEAIQAAIDYNEYKRRADDARKRRDELAVLAWASGVNDCDGWKFSPVAPSQTVTWESVTAYDDEHSTDLVGGFIKWYRASCPLKISASMFKEYLAAEVQDKEARERISAAVAVAEGEGSVRLTAPKKSATDQEAGA